MAESGLLDPKSKNFSSYHQAPECSVLCHSTRYNQENQHISVDGRTTASAGLGLARVSLRDTGEKDLCRPLRLDTPVFRDGRDCS